MNSTDEVDPLRIALFSQALPSTGASNGVVTYTRIMRDALRELGHDVYVATTEHIEHPDGRVTELPRINRLIGSLKLRAASMRGEAPGDHWVRINVEKAFEACRRLGVQVFEIEETSGWAGVLVGRGVAIVERLHGPHVFIRDPSGNPAEKRRSDRRVVSEFAAMRRVQAVTSPTRGLLEALAQEYGVEPTLSRVVPNPMPVATGAAMWNAERAIPGQLLAVGRFDSCKGADVVLRAFASAADKRPELALVMAGPDNGLIQSGGGLLHFNDFVRAEIPPEIRSRITFTGSQLPSRISELRLESAVAVVGSRFETFAYTIAEAMAVGMPTLTTATFGGLELIRDHVDGRVVPVADVEKMADAMVELIDMPKKLIEFGRSACDRAAQMLSPALAAKQTVEVYRDAIRRAGHVAQRRRSQL